MSVSVEQFEAAVRDFASNWPHGDRLYTDTKIFVLYGFLKEIELSELNNKLQWLTMDAIHLPSPGKLIGALMPIIYEKRMRRREEERAKLPACEWCQRTGQVSAYHRENGYVYAFRCVNCKAATIENLSKDIPDWGQKFAKDFDPVITKQGKDPKARASPEKIQQFRDFVDAMVRGKKPKIVDLSAYETPGYVPGVPVEKREYSDEWWNK